MIAENKLPLRLTSDDAMLAKPTEAQSAEKKFVREANFPRRS